MTTGPILITSFQVWRSHQPSNSSDDLVAELWRTHRLPKDTVWLRQVPVNFQLAPIRVIAEIARLRPRLVICCGMAENRPYLSVERQAVERQATGDGKILQTSVDVTALLSNTYLSQVSDDAGTYVCNALYYDVLSFIYRHRWPINCVFVHIPILPSPLLKGSQRKLILADFVQITNQLAASIN
jgi:pyroglutamyl-peptidase